MSITARQLFYGAYRNAGMVFLEQTSIGADQEEEARELYNRMIDAWRAEGHTISHISREEFPLVANQSIYTVGPGGNFNTAWQEDIQRASLILTNQTPNAERPMEPLTIDQFQAWTLKDQATNIPQKFWYEKDFPLGKLHILYKPNTPYKVALYLENPMGDIAVAAGSPPNYAGVTLTYPPAYQEAIEMNLAWRIWQRDSSRSSLDGQARAELKESARRSFQIFTAVNNRPNLRLTDLSGTPSRTNVYNGNRWGR